MNLLPVSIIIPTCRRATLLQRCLNSVIDQYIAGDEIIVVDDGAGTGDGDGDSTRDVTSAFGQRVTYIALQSNRGVSVARNIGIRAATNPLLAFLDDDDEWLPNKLLLQRTVMSARPQLAMSFTNFTSEWANGTTQQHCIFNWGHELTDWEKIIGPGQAYSRIATLPAGMADFNVHIGDMYYAQMQDDHVLPSTLMVRKTLTQPELQFNESMRFLNSWECSGRLAKLGPAAYLDCDLTIQHDDNVKRITDASYLQRRIVQTRILESIWGKDTSFLAQHRLAFQRRLDKERLLLVRELLAQGQTQAARAEIAQLHRKPGLLYRALSLLPQALLVGLVKLRHRLKA